MLEDRGTIKAGPLGEMCSLLSGMVQDDDGSDLPKVRIINEKLKELFGSEADSLVLVGGAIATVERFNNFQDSIAHLMDDGRIMRYREQIGCREDIEIVEPEGGRDVG